MNKKLLLANVAILATLFLVSSVATSSQKATARVEPFITLQIKTNAGNNNREQYGLYIQQDLAAIGIEVELLYEEWGVFLGDVFGGDTQGFILGWGGGIDPDWSSIYDSESAMNIYFLNDTHNDELLDEGLVTIDITERKAVYDEWQEYFMTDLLAIIPIYAGDSYIANWAQLDGYDANLGLRGSLETMRWSSPSERGTTDDVVVSTFADTVTLFDGLVSDTASREVTNFIYPSLIEYNGDLVMHCGENSLSATLPTVTVKDNGHVSYIFHLRDDMYWEDGVQVNATDVEFTWDFVLEYEKSGYPYGSTYDGVLFENTTTIIDEFTYNVTFLEPYAPAYYDASGPSIHPEHILNLKNSTGHELFDGIGQTNTWLQYAKTPLSGGMFYLNTWNTDVDTILKLRDDTSTGFTDNYDALATAFADDEALGVTGFVEIAAPTNPAWYNASEYTIDTWQRRVVADIDAEMLEFIAGGVDVTGLDQEYIEEIQGDSNFELQVVPNFGLDYLGFNMNDPLFGTGAETPVGAAGDGGLHLRKAMIYAIDRSRIIEQVRQGYGQVVHSPMYPAQAFWYHPVVYAHSIAEAADEMELAGYDKERILADVTTTTATASSVTTVTESGGLAFNGIAAIAGAISVGILALRRRKR